MTIGVARRFIEMFLQDTRLHRQLADQAIAEGLLTFDQWQQLAAIQGYHFTESDFEAALGADPTLTLALNQLAADYHFSPQPELEFELSEDELATVAGGNPANNFDGPTPACMTFDGTACMQPSSWNFKA